MVVIIPNLHLRKLKLSLTSGKDLSKEKWAAENEVVRYRPQLSGHESEQTLGDSEGWEAWCAAVCGVARSQILLRD